MSDKSDKKKQEAKEHAEYLDKACKQELEALETAKKQKADKEAELASISQAVSKAAHDLEAYNAQKQIVSADINKLQSALDRMHQEAKAIATSVANERESQKKEKELFDNYKISETNKLNILRDSNEAQVVEIKRLTDKMEAMKQGITEELSKVKEAVKTSEKRIAEIRDMEAALAKDRVEVEAIRTENGIAVEASRKKEAELDALKNTLDKKAEFNSKLSADLEGVKASLEERRLAIEVKEAQVNKLEEKVKNLIELNKLKV